MIVVTICMIQDVLIGIIIIERKTNSVGAAVVDAAYALSHAVGCLVPIVLTLLRL